MAADSEQVRRELLTIGFRAQPRGLAHGVLFASLTVALMWGAMPYSTLAAWMAVILVLAAVRLVLARRFLRARPAAGELEGWARRLAVAYGATGFAWGALGAACLAFAPQVPLFALWTLFLILLFAVVQSQTTGSHPLVFHSFTLCAFAPMLLAAAALPAPHYALRLVIGLSLLVFALLIGRSGNRYVAQSIAIRFENLDLLRDLTLQKKALDAANAAKTRFLAAASHDLRQPMHAIALLVESLQDRVREPDARMIIANIESSASAMSDLLNEILDICKLDAGTIKPRVSSFPVARVLDRVRAAFAHAAEDRSLELRVRASDAIASTDEVLLYRILANLVHNALRYTERGGVLVVCRGAGDALSIEVWDTGIGIPPDKRTEVFQEFYQLGNPHRDRERGFGLGLAIVERTARLLELPLALRSRVGHGSVFTLRVPRGDPARVETAQAEAPESLENCAVLVVEDDRAIAVAITLLLEGWKCRVAIASSSAEVDAALARLGTPPDVIVADLRLPGDENGLQVIARVCARHPDASPVVVTGDVAAEALAAAHAAGYPVLHKPVRPARLRALLGAAMREQGSRAWRDVPATVVGAVS